MKSLRNSYLNLIFKKKKNFFESIIFLMLRFLSFIYLISIIIKDFISVKGKKNYKGIKIISIGNITWGGTGKTSLTMFLIKILESLGKKPIVIQRGYPKNFKRPIRVNIKHGQNYTDEGILIKKSFPEIPVYLSRNRIKAIEEAKKIDKFEYVLLDDAFQYRKLKKDLDIVIIDSLNPFGNNLLIPAGSLREPLFRIKHANLIILSHCEIQTEYRIKEIEADIRKYNRTSLILHLYYRIKNIEELKRLNGDFGAFCGIGNPESFFKLLKKEGFILREEIVFPDHYDYKKLNLSKDIIWLTTGKDFVKLKDLNICDIYEVEIEIWLKEEEKLRQLFLTETAH